MTISSFFLPNRQIIESITRANPGVVTTTEDHGYLSGLFVRLVLQRDSGMPEVAGKVYLIDVLSSNSFSIDADTTNFEPFDPESTIQSPQVIPVGEISEILTMAVRNGDHIIPET